MTHRPPLAHDRSKPPSAGRRVVALTGGVGGARLLHGLAGVLPPRAEPVLSGEARGLLPVPQRRVEKLDPRCFVAYLRRVLAHLLSSLYWISGC